MSISKKEKSKTLKEIKRELEKCQEEAKKYLTGWKREKADFMNYKKQREREMVKFRELANEDIIINLLPVIDNFNLAVQHLPKELEESDWVKGILHIKVQLENFLKGAGVEEIKSVGEKFNPEYHEIAGKRKSEEEEDVIVGEIRKGYEMKGRVIRAARVIVSSGESDLDEN